MRTLLSLAAISLAAACGRGYAVGPVTGPAGAGSLECALRFATEAGYKPVGGGVSDGYIRFEQPYTVPLVTGVGARTREVTVTVASGQMRAVGSADRLAQTHIREIAQHCSGA